LVIYRICRPGNFTEEAFNLDISRYFSNGVALKDHASRDVPPVAYSAESEKLLSNQDVDKALLEIKAWPGYKPTPVYHLSRLARYLDCGDVFYKDESERFGLGSFKALGGAYAVLCLVASVFKQTHARTIPLASIRNGEHRDFAATLTVTTATDGNHGRSVAWGARNAGCRCRIYIHREVSEGRKAAMEAYGAEVIRIDGDYDESVRLCSRESAAHGWFVVSDTSYEGYMEVPADVMAGYTVMASELLQQVDKPFTHVLVPAGVGGLAAAICGRLWMEGNSARPTMIIVESEHAACWLESFRCEHPAQVAVTRETVMAGLSCGEVSPLAWAVMSGCADHVVTIGDEGVAPAMRLFADAQMAEQPIEAGECAVAGALALMGICQDKNLQRRTGIDSGSRILLIGSEGATDPEVYRQLLASVY